MIATSDTDTTPMTLYWTKYITMPQKTKKQQREDMIDARLLRTEKYKNTQVNLSEYDQIAYLR